MQRLADRSLQLQSRLWLMEVEVEGARKIWGKAEKGKRIDQGKGQQRPEILAPDRSHSSGMNLTDTKQVEFAARNM